VRHVPSMIMVALAAGLSACATRPPQGAEGAEGVKQYCARLYGDPRLAPLKDKIVMPLSVDEPQPIDILANRSRPTEAERSAIRVLSDVRKECGDYAAVHLGPPPGYRQRAQSEITMALAELYAGEMTYGQFGRAVLFIGDRDKAAREDIDQSVVQRERWAGMDLYH
jgi:hypothetical protein